MTKRYTFNGLDGTTGRYLFPVASAEDLARTALASATPKDQTSELRRLARVGRERTLGPTYGLDPRDLGQVGWGLVLPNRSDSLVLEALRPLLDLRKEAAGDLYREYTGPDGYQSGESKNHFLARHGAASGPVRAGRVPYYLLLVGTPEEIPFRFQYQLGVQYAVGRLCLESPESYCAYAEAVVEAGRAASTTRDRTLALFGVRNPGDRATELSHDNLILPLAKSFAGQSGWRVNEYSRDSATKQHLSDLLGGAKTPSVLLTASHGIGYPRGHQHQLRRQGALVCQEWEGPGTPVDRAAIFCAEDVSRSAALNGLIVFHFACYSGGTPRLDGFFQAELTGTESLADHPFVAQLPMRLLGHPRSPALAVVGHVDRAWGYSFMSPTAGAQVEVFRACLARLADGYPLGSAMEYFGMRYAELASDLGDLREQVHFGRTLEPGDLSATWTACNDARNYVILGDPAVTPR